MVDMICSGRTLVGHLKQYCWGFNAISFLLVMFKDYFLFLLRAGSLLETKKQPLGPPAVPFHPFSGEGSPTQIDYTEKGWYPYSNLSTGGPGRESTQCSLLEASPSYTLRQNGTCSWPCSQDLEARGEVLCVEDVTSLGCCLGFFETPPKRLGVS